MAGINYWQARLQNVDFDLRLASRMTNCLSLGLAVVVVVVIVTVAAVVAVKLVRLVWQEKLLPMVLPVEENCGEVHNSWNIQFGRWKALATRVGKFKIKSRAHLLPVCSLFFFLLLLHLLQVKH